MNISGIYKIQSKIKPEKIYIGSAVNISERWRLHLLKLKKNNHKNSKLQNHYNKYGISDFQFEILLGCEKEDLIKTEQYFIDSYNPWFNICKKAGNSLGIKRTDEWKEKQRKSQTGKKDSDETRLKKSESNKGKHGNKRTINGQVIKRKPRTKSETPIKRKPHSEETKQKMRHSPKSYKKREKRAPYKRMPPTKETLEKLKIGALRKWENIRNKKLTA